jgi:DNA invertase Pin-like site-specific DNA recombinase
MLRARLSVDLTPGVSVIRSDNTFLANRSGKHSENFSSATARSDTCGAIGYLRVSTESQADSGLGLEAQQTAIDAAAVRLGLSLIETFTDTVSGGLALECRPALLAALELTRTGDVLLVAKRDRLGRDVLNVAMIERLVERRGARVYSAAGEGTDDDSPTGRLMRQIIDAFAEYERALIRARTRAAMAAAKKRGQRVGQIPFGMALGEDGCTLVPNAEERAVLAEIHRLRNQGYALFSIAEELNERGLSNRQGRPWQANFIGQLLSRHPENGNH